MVSLSAAASALLLVASDATSLRTEQNRRLSYQLIAGYEPRSQVTDHNAIDLDQNEMEVLLATGTHQSFQQAMAVYTQGGYSKSLARVTLRTPLTSLVKAGTEVSGLTASNNEVIGKTFEDYASGTKVVDIQYHTSDIQSTYVGCQVGGLPTPFTEGCFNATGKVTLDGAGGFRYTYNPLVDNKNNRTLQGFSTQAEQKMYRCANCPYRTFQKFYDYYGVFDYANQWVMAAFSGSKTSFSNGNADFSSYSYEGKSEIIKKGTAYMSVWMYMIREMENQLDNCQEGCTGGTCNKDTTYGNPVYSWDEAVAFYSGSLEGTDGSGNGKLLHQLADKRCVDFKTCGEFASEITGLSNVNMLIFKEFKIGQDKILQGQCASAREQKERIEELMAIPLIQGVLRYAYITEFEDSGEKSEAEGATFAAAVLPLIHACNADAATTIYNNLKVGQGGSANFAAVKAAFESTYECLKIDCANVGGFWDEGTGAYFEGASPCSYVSSSSSSSRTSSGSSSAKQPNVGLIVGLTFAGLVVLALAIVFFRRRASAKQLDLNHSEEPKVNPAEGGQEGPAEVM